MTEMTKKERREKRQQMKALEKALRPYLWTMWNDEIATTYRAFNNYIFSQKSSSKTTRTAMLRAQLKSLSESQNHRCCYCGTNTWHPEIKDYGYLNQTTNNRATIEHVISKSKGGTNTFENLVMACCECNQLRGDTDVDKFLKSIQQEESAPEGTTLTTQKDQKMEERILKVLYLFVACYPAEFQETLKYVEGEFYKSLVNRPQKRNKKKSVDRLNAIRRRIRENKMAA